MSTNPKTVEGIYRGGKVELLETPADVDEARVIADDSCHDYQQHVSS